MKTYVTKRSARMAKQKSGMVRSASDGKMDWSLIADGPMLERWAGLLDRGAVIYGKRNWCKALKASTDELRAVCERFHESVWRHFMQWARGDKDEDHAAAIVFNLNGYEACKAELGKRSRPAQAKRAKPSTAWRSRKRSRKPARKDLTDDRSVSKTEGMSI